MAAGAQAEARPAGGPGSHYRRRLRSRIIVSFLLFGTLLSGAFAVSVFILQDYIADQLITATLRADIDRYVRQLRTDPTSAEPFYTRIEGYVTRPGKTDIVPPVFRDLPSGEHEVNDDGKSYRAAVRKEDDFWVFLTYDVTADRRITRQLVLAMTGVVALFAVLSLTLGAWSAGRVMSPVRELAERVRAMGDDSSSLAQYFANDEVGRLAAALDDYAARLRELVARDAAFNADVSHELRTPLAVISGATELLLAMPDLPAKARQRLLRIARAARQSTDITAALLHLGRAERGTTAESNARDVGQIAEQIAEQHRELIGGRELKITVKHVDPVHVIAPESVIAVVIANLLGNAVRYTPAGEIRVGLEAGTLKIEDTGPGLSAEELPRVFERHYRGKDSGGKGAGLGLAIVKRLCELYGWQVHFETPPAGGLRVIVSFYPAHR